LKTPEQKEKDRIKEYKKSKRNLREYGDDENKNINNKLNKRKKKSKIDY
jgi:hypothetical protein